MENRENLYEPVMDFRKQRNQMQIKTITSDELYERAFFAGEEPDTSEYTANTTTWD